MESVERLRATEMSDLTNRIKEAISQAMPDAEVMVLDPMNDGAHLEAVVISDAFRDMPLVQQHRVVMKSLKQAFASDLHALALKTYTPEKVGSHENLASSILSSPDND